VVAGGRLRKLGRGGGVEPPLIVAVSSNPHRKTLILPEDCNLNLISVLNANGLGLMGFAGGLRAVGMNWVKNHIDPEKLWMQYAFALCVTIGMLVSIYAVNNALIQHNQRAIQTVNASDDLTVQSQRILLLAMKADDAAMKQIPELVRQFETSHLSLLQGDFWSSALQEHYFSGENPLNAQVREFADLAIQLTAFPPDRRPQLISELRDRHGAMGLFDGLQKTASLFGAEAEVGTTYLQGLLQKILALSAVVLVAEALLIFLPAHLTVKSVFKELRNKTEVLCGSQDQLRRMNEKLSHLVNHDPLTGLPNRACMASYINDHVDPASAIEMGVLFVGLDGFKAINDTIGHENADILLIAVAGRLRNCVDDDDMVARIGGDEFILTTAEPPEELAKRVLSTLSDPFSIDGRNVNISSSIGYLTAYHGNYEPDQILGNAGIAMQTAKSAGGRQAVAFTQAMRDDTATMQQLQLELREAIELGQIEPWFQPQVNLADGSLPGTEVLARWRHPKRGLLTPDKFLPAAERAGLIIELDHAIWRAAIGCANQWQTDGVWHPTISLNAAPDTISDPFLIERLLKQMHASDLNLDQIIIEVLETTVIEGSDDMAAINIDGLAECGMALELDDFGTGYASLSRLTQLPLTGLKLDR